MPMETWLVSGLVKSVPAGLREIALGFGAAAAEHALHFLGGLELEVFAQVAVAAGDRKFP